jgi:predicted RNase H-like nuclease (RuvC/YqgF family)
MTTETEEAEVARERLENGNLPKRSAVQKRMDKLTRDKHSLRQENRELRDVLERYEATIRRYKQALMEAKKDARR